LVRGEYGHEIIDELKPRPGEPVVDKPGKGAFYATDLNEILKSRGIRQLLVCGVTTEVCVNTTLGRQTIAAMTAWWSKMRLPRTFPSCTPLRWP